MFHMSIIVLKKNWISPWN